MVPLVAVLLFWFFLRGWATHRKRWFILAGFFMGLAAYTYSAARLLPVILVLAILPEFLAFLPRSASSLKTYAIRNTYYLLIFAFTAALTSLPMAWYLLTHPAQFAARAGSVMVWYFLATPTEIMAEIGRNLLRVVGFFGWQGSPNPIFGPPNYPGSPLILAPFLLSGLVICRKNWRDLFHRLVAVWWLVGILPSIFAIEAPHPWRMIVAVVPTAILIALGLTHFIAWLSPLRNTHYAIRLLSFLLILLPTPALFKAYFNDWTRLPVTQGIYDYGALAIRDVILDQQSNDTPLYLP
jgi:hypothetical protein